MEYLDKSAIISDDGKYRYNLTRKLSLGANYVLFVGLNPSTADATLDDPTIRRCVGFAKSWGFNWMLMGNLYAFRATDPQMLRTSDNPVGPRNREELEKMVSVCDLVIAAWGSNPLTLEAQSIADWIVQQGNVKCLGQNKNGSPKHPLYLAKSTEPRDLTI